MEDAGLSLVLLIATAVALLLVAKLMDSVLKLLRLLVILLTTSAKLLWVSATAVVKEEFVATVHLNVLLQLTVLLVNVATLALAFR